MDPRAPLSRPNDEGLTYHEWLAASRWQDSRKTRKAWRSGEDPTDWRAACPPDPPPPPRDPYEYVRRGPVPDDVRAGDFVHDDHGTWELWRVISVYEKDSPYFNALRVTGSKFSKPGDRTELLRKDRHVLEADPDGFVRHFRLEADLSVEHKEGYR